MIWMGVGEPGDWNALGNRFPTHYQALTGARCDDQVRHITEVLRRLPTNAIFVVI